MFSVWEHRKKLCWIWDRINAHNIIAIFYWMARLAKSMTFAPVYGVNRTTH